MTRDQYILDDTVRYWGEGVAAVAAVSEEIAQQAIDLIEVTYQPLPAVFTIEDAMKPDAPQIHAVSRRLVVEVPDFDADPLNLVRRDLGCVWYTDGDHVREYTRSVLKQHMERNGWTPVQWEFRGGMMLVVAEADARKTA